MKWIAIAFGVVLSAHLFERVRLVQRAQTYRSTWARQLAILTSARHSEHWKERAIALYARRTLRLSAVLVGCLAIIVLPLALITLAGESIFGGYYQALASTEGLLLSIVSAGVYLVGKRLLFTS